MEVTRVKQFHNYTLYGYYGVTILFIPSPYSIFGIDSQNGKLLSNVNSGDRLDLNTSRKCRNYFDESSGFLNLMGLILLFGTFFPLLYGVDNVKNKPFLRFCSSLSTPGKLFWASSISRILLLMMAFFILLGLSLFWLLLHGVNLFQPQIFSLITSVILLILFFFIIGCIIGSLKDKSIRLIIFGVFYFLSIIIIPGLADKHTRDDADDIEPLFPFELKNLELIMSLEKRALEKVGVYKDDGDIAPEKFIKMVKQALNDEFKIIFAREEKMMVHILKKIRNRHTVSCLFPVLFYNSVNLEVSGCGDLSYMDFYNYSKQRKKEFLDFYVEKKFLTKSQPVKVESFVKKDENLFYAQSHLPFRFWFGIMFSLIVYAGAGGIGAYFCFKRSLRPTPEKNSTEKVDINLKRGEDYHIDTADYAAVDHFYNVFTGKIKGFKGKITIDNKNIVTGEKKDVIYICSPEDIPPEVKVIDLLRLFKGLLKLSKQQVNELKSGVCKDVLDKLFSELSPDLQLKLLFQIGCLKGGTIYMLHDLINKCSSECIKEFAEDIKTLKAANAIILYFKDSALAKQLKVDHHIAYTRVDGYYEWHEARD
jgi:hypothetical protein